jgi:antitoxin component of MazEF toxin-antitoxin module
MIMKAKVTKDGVLIPKNFLEGVEEVEIRKENGLILVTPQAVHQIAEADGLSAESSPESRDFYVLSQRGLANAYGDDEPEYSLDLIKEPNPDYEGR